MRYDPPVFATQVSNASQPMEEDCGDSASTKTTKHKNATGKARGGKGLREEGRRQTKDRDGERKDERAKERKHESTTNRKTEERAKGGKKEGWKYGQKALRHIKVKAGEIEHGKIGKWKDGTMEGEEMLRKQERKKHRQIERPKEMNIETSK